LEVRQDQSSLADQEASLDVPLPSSSASLDEEEVVVDVGNEAFVEDTASSGSWPEDEGTCFAAEVVAQN